MSSSKKETKKSKIKETSKSDQPEEKTTPKKDPKVLSQEVEEKIKALADKNTEDDSPKKEISDDNKTDKNEEETTKDSKASEIEDKPVEEKKADSKTSTADTDSEKTEIPPYKKAEHLEDDKENDTDEELPEANKDNDSSDSEGEEDEISVVQSDSLFSRSIAPILIGIVVGVITAGSIIFFYNSRNNLALGPTPTPTEAESPTPEPTSTPSIIDDLTLYDITVLNGSGTSGEAAKIELLLEDKGFSVLDVGNAANSNFTYTIIQAKEGVPQTFIDKLKSILSETYTVEVNDILLNKGEESDVIVTIGSLEAEVSTTSATPIL